MRLTGGLPFRTAWKDGLFSLDVRPLSAATPSWDIRREEASRTPAHSSRATDSPDLAGDFPSGESTRLVLPDTPPRERPPGGA